MQTSQKPENTILTTQEGLEVELLNYGATLKSIRVKVGDDFVNVLLNYPVDQGPCKLSLRQRLIRKLS